MDYLTEFKQEGFAHQKLFRLPRRAEKRARSRAFTRDCVVTDAGYYPQANGHLVDRSEGATGEILVFCISGRGWFSVDHRRREVSAGQAFHIPAKVAHSYGAHRSDPWEIYWVHADGTRVAELLSWTPFTRQRPLLPFSNIQALKRQFNTLLLRLEAGYTDHTLLEMSRFFVSLCSLMHREGGSSQELAQKEKIELAMNKMRETLAESHNLEHYARTAGFSVSQFSYLFKRHYGTSPMAYLTELRVQLAREMLETTNTPIKQIAAKLGYEDPLYFSRLFKKTAGLPPSSYRDGAMDGRKS